MSKKKKKMQQFENTKTVIDLAKKSSVPDWKDYVTKYDELLTKMAKLEWDEAQSKMKIDGVELTVEPALTVHTPPQYYETQAQAMKYYETVIKPKPYSHHSAQAKPHSTTFSKQCPKCLAPLMEIWQQDAYICPTCNIKYTGEYLWFQKQYTPPSEHTQDPRDEIEELKNALHYVEKRNRALQERLNRLLHQEQQILSLFLAAKQISGLAFAGDETPDEEIEEALTILLAAVSQYEASSSQVTVEFGDV